MMPVMAKKALTIENKPLDGAKMKVPRLNVTNKRELLLYNFSCKVVMGSYNEVNFLQKFEAD